MDALCALMIRPSLHSETIQPGTVETSCEADVSCPLIDVDHIDPARLQSFACRHARYNERLNGNQASFDCTLTALCTLVLHLKVIDQSSKA